MMTSPASISKGWHYFSEMVTIYCDHCDEPVDYDGTAYCDEYEAVEALTYKGGEISIELNGDLYEHFCPSCIDQVGWCSWCDSPQWSDDMWVCAESYCSEKCRDDEHEEYMEPHDPVCDNCGWINTDTAKDAVEQGTWVFA
jgi:hypothetical protein